MREKMKGWRSPSSRNPCLCLIPLSRQVIVSTSKREETIRDHKMREMFVEILPVVVVKVLKTFPFSTVFVSLKVFRCSLVFYSVVSVDSRELRGKRRRKGERAFVLHSFTHKLFSYSVVNDSWNSLSWITHEKTREGRRLLILRFFSFSLTSSFVSERNWNASMREMRKRRKDEDGERKNEWMTTRKGNFKFDCSREGISLRMAIKWEDILSTQYFILFSGLGTFSGSLKWKSDSFACPQADRERMEEENF